MIVEDNDADLMAGFDADTPTETPEMNEQPTAETPVTEPRYAQITEDEYADLRQRASRVEELQAEQVKLRDTAFGKIGGIERRVQELASGGAGLSEADIAPFVEDFPELASVLGKLRGPGSVNIDDAVAAKMQPMVSDLERKFEQRLLKREHPDWQQVTQAPEFGVWASSKPTEYQQQLADSWDADFIASALSEFKQAKPKSSTPSTPSRKDVLQAAIQPRGTGSAQAAGTSPEDDFEAGFNSA